MSVSDVSDVSGVGGCVPHVAGGTRGIGILRNIVIEVVTFRRVCDRKNTPPSQPNPPVRIQIHGCVSMISTATPAMGQDRGVSRCGAASSLVRTPAAAIVKPTSVCTSTRHVLHVTDGSCCRRLLNSFDRSVLVVGSVMASPIIVKAVLYRATARDVFRGAAHEDPSSLKL